jgi:hypothetical protein
MNRSERFPYLADLAAKHGLTADELLADMNSGGGAVFRTDSDDTGPDDTDAAWAKFKAKRDFKAARRDARATYQAARKDAKKTYRAARKDARSQFSAAKKMIKANFNSSDPSEHFQSETPDAAKKGAQKGDDGGGISELRAAKKARLLKTDGTPGRGNPAERAAREKMKKDGAAAWRKTVETGKLQ